MEFLLLRCLQPASIFPDESKELLQTAYDKHNINYHLDDGTWIDTCLEMIPFDNLTIGSWGDMMKQMNFVKYIMTIFFMRIYHPENFLIFLSYV